MRTRPMRPSARTGPLSLVSGRTRFNFSSSVVQVSPLSSVVKIAQRVRAGSGVQFTTHELRHTFATWALRKSKNLYAVSKSLGHSQLRQTEIYVSAEVSDLRDAVNQLPGLDSW